MKQAHSKQNPMVWAALIALMLALTFACMFGCDALYRAVSASRATAATAWPYGIVATEPADYPLENGVQKVEKGLDADGELAGWLVTVSVEQPAATTCTVVIAPDGKSLGGIRNVSGSEGGRYYNIRVQLPYFTEQFEGRVLPINESQVDMASGATGSSQAVVALIQTATEFVNHVING
ncbi:MAG: FMN-binding protein [Clostridia bacterium]|nr:FMN-binding protein [Clostridia bacterium]